MRVRKKSACELARIRILAPKFAELNDDVLFGQVWSREDRLSLRDRSIVTATALMAQGLVDSSFRYHLESAKKNGVIREEIADHYIERLCDSYAEDVEFRRAEVRVATSDALEQTIILGRGATRISSRELLMEMSQARSAGTAAAVPKRTGGSTVGDRIPPHVLEKLRRIGK